MKKLLLSLILGSLLCGTAAFADDMAKQRMKIIHHTNPLPNLMQVIIKKGDELNLSEEQAKALKGWHSENSPRIMQDAKQIMAVEKKLHDEALAGASGDELQKLADESFRLRMEIMKIKLACRNNMHQVLKKDQWDKLLKLYAAMNSK